MPRMKKFPPLHKFVREPKPAQTPDQMLAIAKQWTMALGGTITGPQS